MSTIYANVIVPLPVGATFTYSVPNEMAEEVKVGCRVVVPFGKKKYVTGIVCSLAPVAPVDYEVKPIAIALDSKPIVRFPQIKFWEWIAEYYMCAIGDVYKAAVPAALKVESETYVEINPDIELADELMSLTEIEVMIMQLLQHEGSLPVADIEKKLQSHQLTRSISCMLESGHIIISEKLVERYRPERKSYVVPLFNSDNYRDAFESVKGARKQEQLLQALLSLSDIHRPGVATREVERDTLLKRADVAPAILSALVKKGLVAIHKKEVNRFKFDGEGSGDLPELSEVQQQALSELYAQFRDKSTVLLHGVTASGKTEIYSHLIEQQLNQGNQVLYLVPEIALTTQLTQRLQKIFGNRVVVYHSKFSDNERVDIWKKMLDESKPWVILGARSSLFLPFSRLGLVIVDEEHDASYKQTDPAPRYNARDAAIVLASMHGAKTLLGSATPAIDTYFKATSGKYGLVTLSRRFNNQPLPPIKIIDLTAARKKKEMTGPLTISTIQAVNQTLDNNKQAIFFRNRRGFAPIARCKQCAWIPKCHNCDVTLTYHQSSHKLVCHYCGATYPLPNLCPQCRQPSVEVIGYGTERVEEELLNLFPSRKIIRMDLDTTRNKGNYQSLIEQFSAGKADILIGTQMVTKGLDFKNVKTVTVVNADELITFPDFKSSERGFNMLEQVAGRAGRGDSDGASVLVQTYQP
ncbi:MAG: primosomal protein N', partial [Muribaculaceae bacterium]|nr:primosomal protein N' [Muribaculaceae bacterium]